MPDWLGQRLTPKRLEHICKQIQSDNGRQLVDKVINNLPASLMVLLPLMAAMRHFHLRTWLVSHCWFQQWLPLPAYPFSPNFS